MEIFFLSLSLPWFLLIVERFFPYPYIVEEIVKLAVVIFILKQKEEKKNQWEFFLILVFAIGFSLSEAILYLNVILTISDLSLFFVRLFFTGILHLLTTAIIYLFGKSFSFWGLIFGLLMAMVVHYCYNWLIGVYFL